MFFTTAAVALAAASLAMAQDATVNSLTQCAQSTLPVGSTGPYYVAVVPAANPCGSDALAEYYDVTGQSVDYYVNIPSGTQVQIYTVDANGAENWSSVLTVGDGDAACLGSDASVTTSTDSSSSSSTDSSTPSSSAAPTTYVPPNAIAATTAASGTYSPSSNSGSVSNNGDDTTPANAADDTTTTGGASTVTASATLLVGAFAAALALF